MRCFSPSKINLFFRVLGRRDDGYHEIASLYQATDLVDELEISLSDRDLLTCSDPLLPLDSSNLVWKAVDLFRRHTGLSFKATIHLHKNVPVCAGLGGGSGNAATTLWMLSQITGLHVPDQELARWGGEIGSDISFFFSSGTAFCTGRGELVESLYPLQPTPLWLICPKEGLSTPAVFKALSLADVSSLAPLDLLERCYEDPVSWDALCVNDLEAPAFSVLPRLHQIKELLLQEGLDAVCMTGSGSALFCLGERAPPYIEGATIFRANFLNRTPATWYDR